MTNLPEVLRAIDQLSPDELEQVRHHIELRRSRWQRQPLTTQGVEAWIAALDAAIDRFREGLSESELDRIVEAMNVEDIEQEDSTLFEWLDDLPENER